MSERGNILGALLYYQHHIIIIISISIIILTFTLVFITMYWKIYYIVFDLLPRIYCLVNLRPQVSQSNQNGHTDLSLNLKFEEEAIAMLSDSSF